jgi:DNA-binding transcriptional LysR family regulator
MPAELVQPDISRGTLVKIVAADAPEGYVVAISAVYRTDAPPGIAGRWFIDRLKQGSQSAARKRVQPHRKKRG